MNPAPTDPGTNAPATNDNACASDADDAKLISTLLFAKIFEFEILHVYGADDPDQLEVLMVALIVWS